MPKKKPLRLKCTGCNRLLGAEFFKGNSQKGHYNSNTAKLICVSCTRVCSHCSQRLPLSRYPTDGSNLCTHCVGKKEKAESNVYFRYPTLRYKAVPYSVDKYRDKLAVEADDDMY